MKDIHDIIRHSCRDELEKIAGEMQGHTRIGRRPISVERLLERETPAPSSVLEKIAGTGSKLFGAGTLAGAAGYHYGRKANEDRKLGKMVRIQSSQQQS